MRIKVKKVKLGFEYKIQIPEKKLIFFTYWKTITNGMFGNSNKDFLILYLKNTYPNIKIVF